MYMAKTRNSSHIKVSPVFLLVVLFLGGFGVVQIVRAATGGIPGSPGARYDAVQATNFISTESYSFTPMPGMTVLRQDLAGRRFARVSGRSMKWAGKP